MQQKGDGDKHEKLYLGFGQKECGLRRVITLTIKWLWSSFANKMRNRFARQGYRT